jgi:hypothetical protein
MSKKNFEEVEWRIVIKGTFKEVVNAICAMSKREISQFFSFTEVEAKSGAKITVESN